MLGRRTSAGRLPGRPGSHQQQPARPTGHEPYAIFPRDHRVGVCAGSSWSDRGPLHRPPVDQKTRPLGPCNARGPELWSPYLISIKNEWQILFQGHRGPFLYTDKSNLWLARPIIPC